ncbi:radical SAM protein [bacterium]|nr:radical SAM protein [bacterium]
MHDRIIPVFIPFMGCAGKCIYCNQSVITSTPDTEIEFEKQLIQAEKNTFQAQIPFQIGFYGGTFLEIKDYYFSQIILFLNKISKNEKFMGIRFSTTPESVCRNLSRILLLKRFNLKLVELGVQTFNEDILKKIGRKTTKEDIDNSIKLLASHDIKWVYQVMPGLPSENFQEFYKLCDYYFSNYPPEYIRIYPLLVFKNTELERQYRKGLYVPLSMEESICYVKALYLLARKKKIGILKIGIHPEKSVFQSCVAGPLSGHLKEMMKGSIIVDWIMNKIQENTRFIEIHISSQFQSWIRGDKCAVLKSISDLGIKYKIISTEKDNNNLIALKIHTYNDKIIKKIIGHWEEICESSRKLVLNSLVLREQ